MHAFLLFHSNFSGRSPICMVCANRRPTVFSSAVGRGDHWHDSCQALHAALWTVKPRTRSQGAPKAGAAPWRSRGVPRSGERAREFPARVRRAAGETRAARGSRATGRVDECASGQRESADPMRTISTAARPSARTVRGGRSPPSPTRRGGTRHRSATEKQKLASHSVSVMSHEVPIVNRCLRAAVAVDRRPENAGVPCVASDVVV